MLLYFIVASVRAGLGQEVGLTQHFSCSLISHRLSSNCMTDLTLCSNPIAPAARGSLALGSSGSRCRGNSSSRSNSQARVPTRSHTSRFTYSSKRQTINQRPFATGKRASARDDDDHATFFSRSRHLLLRRPDRDHESSDQASGRKGVRFRVTRSCS